MATFGGADIIHVSRKGTVLGVPRRPCHTNPCSNQLPSPDKPKSGYDDDIEKGP